MNAEEARRLLVHWAKVYRARDPEECAQQVLLRAWRKHGHLNFIPTYWQRAIRNEVFQEHREAMRHPLANLHLMMESGWDVEEEHDSTSVPIQLPDVPETQWLLAYYRNLGKPGGHTAAEKIKAMRYRKKLKERITQDIQEGS